MDIIVAIMPKLGNFAVEIEETGRKALKRLNFFVKFSFFSCSTVGTVV